MGDQIAKQSDLRLPVLLTAGFIGCYILCAIFFQLLGSRVSWYAGSPLEFFTGATLWMLSLVCLLQAIHWTRQQWIMVFWLASCAALALLAIDEVFEFHERTEKVGINDDHVKVVMWLFSAPVLVLICRMEKASPTVKGVLILGYFFHSLYLLVEVGDGEYFRLPFGSIETLKWTEEICELLFLTSYLEGFLLLHIKNSSKGDRGGRTG